MKSPQRPSVALAVASALALAAVLSSAAVAERPSVVSQAMPWQQLSPALSFSLVVERERYTTLDRSARLVLAVEAGKGGPSLDALAVKWTVLRGNRPVVQQQGPIARGLLSVDIGLASLPEGRYDVSAQLLNGDQKLAEGASFFRVERAAAPAQEGRVALVLPSGVPLPEGTYPVQAGVPFPKGALWSTDHVRLVDSQGRAVPCGLAVRSRWGSGEASIRWLGVDLQAPAEGAWWPERRAPQYFLEFGPQVGPGSPNMAVTALERPEGIAVDTGALSFLVRRRGFNLIDDVKLGGKSLLKSSASHGLYLVDHQGATYRAANDAGVTLAVEERNGLRVVVRAEGWYVKDGTAGKQQSFTLPTDKLCRFVTRIEAYAGKPYVRVLSTWINTFDTFSVRLRDLGIALPFPEARASSARFGVEGRESIAAAVPADGIRLVQHLHDQFVVEDGAGKTVATGQRSAGWAVAESQSASLAISHRDTWQRFPKEIEVLPAGVRLHVWPAHGRDHPEINPVARDQVHRLWFAHQGREMNMSMPWDYYFAVSEYVANDPNIRGKAEPQAHAGVFTSGMGTAVTSDLLVHFTASGDGKALIPTAECFQSAPHALADPKWTCDSLAMGYLHPYDPANFQGFEEIISDHLRGYWDTQDAGKMFGMWVYRSWHHSAYNGDGSWMPYRLFNGSHHHEAIMPWVFYARSGDPFYLRQGRANIRQLSDVQIIHHADAACEKKEAISPNQGKLVGSMLHDNSLSPWGGDHAVHGHPTCYNGLMLGYYLTGDLRLREVVVDEWQSTIVSDRGHPASLIPFGDKGSLQQGRENSNPVGELIDLYQLTYDPRVLVVLAPRLDVWLHGGKGASESWLYSFWGHPLHHVLLFHGSEEVRKSLMAGVAAHRGGKPPPPGGLWVKGDFGGAESYAMAGILDPQSTYAADGMSGWGAARASGIALARVEPLILYPVADYLRWIPRLMYALAHSSRSELAGVLGDAQPMPLFWSPGQPLRCIVREDRDQEFQAHIIGTVRQANGVEVQAFGPDGALISRTTVPPGRHCSFPVVIPKDGRTGQYVLFAAAYGQGANGDDLSLPLTTLPEVYSVKTWVTGGSSPPGQFFTRSPGKEPCEVTIGGERTKMLAADKRALLGFTNKDKAADTVRVGPDGAWICGHGASVSHSTTADKSPVVLSTSPGRWFAPSAQSLGLKPAP